MLLAETSTEDQSAPESGSVTHTLIDPVPGEEGTALRQEDQSLFYGRLGDSLGYMSPLSILLSTK